MFFRTRGSANGSEHPLRRLSDRYRVTPTARLACRIAKALLKRRRFDEAFRWAKHAKVRFPESRRAEALYRRLKGSKTRAALRQARARAKRVPTAENLVRLAELLRISGRPRKAFAIALRADREFPDDWQVAQTLGRLYFDRYSRTRSEDDGWQAVEYLDNSRCLQPYDYATLILLAICLARLGSYEDALTVVEEAVQVLPSDRRALTLRAHIRHKLGDRPRGPGRRPRERSSSESDLELIERLMALAGAAGACHLDAKGQATGNSTQENDAFDFDVPIEVFESMAKACQLDTKRIGLGQLRSCSLAGEGWSVVYHTCDSGGTLAFFEGDLTAEQAEEAVRGALASARSRPVGTVAGSTR